MWMDSVVSYCISIENNSHGMTVTRGVSRSYMRLPITAKRENERAVELL